MPFSCASAQLCVCVYRLMVIFQSRVDTKVMELVDYNEADSTAEWKLADVRQNRSGGILSVFCCQCC